MKRLSVWILAGMLVIISGCDSQSIYKAKKDFSEKYWAFNDPAEFEFEILETDKPYNLHFNIRNTSKYQYQNIYIQYYLEDSTGMLITKELKNVQLFNSVTGMPLGEGIGDILDIEKTFLEDYTFSNPGKYKLRLDQFMRQDTLPEILSVGLRVEMAE
jgi:gliding motility-associated lipoprotein GldH